MGLTRELKSVRYALDEIRMVDDRGQRIGGFNVRALQSAIGERYLSILRADLAQLIYSSLGGDVRTLFGDSIAVIEQRDDGVYVTFRHSPAERFDLVIGAGGLHSPVRGLVFGPEEKFEKYLGYYAASFSVAGYPRRDLHAYVSYAMPGRQVSRYSLREHRTVFFFVFARSERLPDDLSTLDKRKEILRDVFGQDRWECPDILAALATCSDLYFDSVSQIRMDAWSLGRVALVGDACFCPSLLAGQGSALAMTGAYILAGELKEASGDYRFAFRRYQDIFRPFIIRKQLAGEKFASSFAPRSRLGLVVRNQITRLMSIPMVANKTMGGLLTDPLTLPVYS